MAHLKKYFPGTSGNLEKFFDEDLRDWFYSNFARSGTTVPSVNVKETGDDFQIEVAAPGMKKDDFDISLENNLLTISSEHSEETKEDEDNYTRREFSYQTFRRTFNIPDEINIDEIDAKYSDGLLRIRLPKQDVSKDRPAKKIKVG